MLGVKCLKYKVPSKKAGTYFLNIVVSFKKALTTLERYNKTVNLKKFTRINKINILKSYTN